MRKNRSKRQPIRMTQKQRENQFQDMLAVAFTLLEEYSTAEIAKLSGLCLRTVYRLKSGTATLRTQVGTLQTLGLAAGVVFEFNENGAATITLRKAA